MITLKCQTNPEFVTGITKMQDGSRMAGRRREIILSQILILQIAMLADLDLLSYSIYPQGFLLPCTVRSLCHSRLLDCNLEAGTKLFPILALPKTTTTRGQYICKNTLYPHGLLHLGASLEFLITWKLWGRLSFMFLHHWWLQYQKKSFAKIYSP